MKAMTSAPLSVNTLSTSESFSASFIPTQESSESFILSTIDVFTLS